MLDCAAFYQLLNRHGIEFFTGVPDSLLKDILAYFADNTPPERNIVAANEGNAIALAAGYHLATGKAGLVYMQNSGLGNSVNPLTSLADPDVYSLPMLLVVGWRGEPGVKDEPQHVKQGRVTLGLLETLEIPHTILPADDAGADAALRVATDSMRERNAPYALVVRKGTFEPYSLKPRSCPDYEMAREQALKLVVDRLPDDGIVVSTTGKTSRELFEYREERGAGHARDFLTVGSMGHSSQIALGIALAKPDRAVFCLDGDGAVIMHAGALAIVGERSPANFRHIVFNNGAHDSVGGQPTCGFNIDITAIARASGYRSVLRAQTPGQLRDGLDQLLTAEGPSLLEIRVQKGARKDLGRPTTTPIENKRAFMEFVDRRP